MQRILALFSTALLSILVASCGGGSSDNGGTSPPPAASAKATINAGNAQSIASRSADTAFRSGSLGNATSVIGLTPPRQGGITKVGNAVASKAAPVAEIPVGPSTEPCAVSGSVTISGDVASPATITVGDFFDVDWDNCDDGIGTVADGLLGLTVTSFAGDFVGRLILLGTTIRADAFRVTHDNQFHSIDGEVDLSIDTRTPPITTLKTSGAALTVSTDNSTESLRNFTSTITEDATVIPITVTLTAMGELDSTQFDGTVTYDTPVTFEALGDSYPHTGQLLVAGANDAFVRLTALDEVNVRIEADYDGDGSIDETVDTTWDELLNN